MKKVTLLIICLIFITHQYNFAQDKKNTIDNLMQMYHEYGQFNGTILVSEAGKIIFKKGYGLANMEWDIPNSADTKFRIGSITKQFVSMQIMQLVEQGKINLQGKLIDYLPEYRKDTGQRITIHHLLTHTSGIPSYTGLPGFWFDSSRNPYDIDYMIKHFHSGDLEFEPGTEYKYNNTGYFLLAAILEKVTGKSYIENLKQRILIPLNMKNTGVERNPEIIKKMAGGYFKRNNGFVHDPYFYMKNAFGAGDLYSTVDDLYLWDQALYTETLISDKYKKIMFTPFLNNYAYGWGVFNVGLGETTDSVQVISHSGGINGFNTRIFRIVKDKHLIVLLNNTGGTDLIGMCHAITNILYDMPYELPKKSVADILATSILEQDISQVIDQYYSLKANDEDKYNFDEGELNRLGYQFLGMGRVSEAIEIFKLNVKEYPEASNPYDSLGEAYMLNGEKELAIKNYAKSLEINPKNTNAIVMLSKINKTKSK